MKELNLTEAEKNRMVKAARFAGQREDSKFWQEMQRLMDKRTTQKTPRRPVRDDQ